MLMRRPENSSRCPDNFDWIAAEFDGFRNRHFYQFTYYIATLAVGRRTCDAYNKLGDRRPFLVVYTTQSRCRTVAMSCVNKKCMTQVRGNTLSLFTDGSHVCFVFWKQQLYDTEMVRFFGNRKKNFSMKSWIFRLPSNFSEPALWIQQTPTTFE